MKKELYLDASVISSIDEFHDQMRDLFGLPHYYGRTLDDLWSCLTSYVNPNIRLMVHDYNHLLEIFGPERQAVRDIFEGLTDVCPEMEVLLN
ncbi:MAG: barstar family protein [Bdellovibrionota bacterium]|jgi:RNAse (barnase) inhibitor barstar|nr:barstar family protein [Bdellovibrionota bacterium]